jgi:hypothetical protein
MSNSKPQDADQAAPLDWRKYLPVHPAADEYPLLRDTDPAAFRALVEDIRVHGVHTQLVLWVDDDGNRLLDDGRNRLDVLTEIGVLAVEDEQLVFALTWNGTVWADDGKLHIPVTHCGEDVYGDPYAIVIGHVEIEDRKLGEDDIDRLVKAADVVTYTRTAIERDFRGDVIDSHAPEMPTRFAKQLAQVVRGSLAIGIEHEAAMRLALRCARDSMPQLRMEILLDITGHPSSRAMDVSRRISKPRRTVRRELEALHMIGLLRCDEESSAFDDEKTIWRYSLAEIFDRDTLLTMVALRSGAEM